MKSFNRIFKHYSLRIKIIDLRDTVPYHQPNCFTLSETKINESGPSGLTEREGMWEEIIEYAKKRKICKRQKEFEAALSESICSDMITSKE